MNPCSMRLMSACASPWGVGGTGGGPRGGHGAKQQKNPFSAPVRGIPGSKALWTGWVNVNEWYQATYEETFVNTSTNTFKLTKQLSTGLSSNQKYDRVKMTHGSSAWQGARSSRVSGRPGGMALIRKWRGLQWKLHDTTFENITNYTNYANWS